jgi:hypothetical protein
MNRAARIALLAALACAFALLPGAVRAQAQSYQASTGYSTTTQGPVWYYQYWDGSSYIDMTWDSTNNWWSGPGSYLIVANNWQHPGTYYDSVRKWVAPRAGAIHVTGQVYKDNVSGGDGVNAKVLHNSTVVFTQDIVYNDATGYGVNATMTVSAGDALYFVINRKGDQSGDGTHWDPLVEYTDTPSSGSQWTNVTGGTGIYYNGGNVGIGKNNPNKPLDVVGDVSATGTITGGNIIAKYQDVAEWVPADGFLPAGTVVVLDVTHNNRVTTSSQEYDTRVAGVVSAQPGLALGERGEGKALVATTGRVRVKVDATHAPIHVGDLLVTSGTAGAAMRSEPVRVGGRLFHSPGTIIGKALEPLEKGTGEILVLLSLQ